MSTSIRPAGPRRFVTFTLLYAALAAPFVLGAQNNAVDTKRIVDELQLTEGQTVAEIGAGAGELTVAVARVVGPKGHVYSNELNTSRHATIRAAAERAGVTNVTIVESRPTDANLPPDCCDAIFMRNVYHHLAEPAPMNKSLLASLKSGGRLAIIDFPPSRGKEASSPTDRGESTSHGVSAESVARELAEAGFEIVSTDEQRGSRWFMVVARKPGPQENTE